MTGIFLICYILFPAAVLLKAERTVKNEVLLEKEDTDVIKGIAACFVIIMHLTKELKPDMAFMRLVLKLSSGIGGMGVLLFFFVSGYGIYKGYAHKTPNVGFLYKRFINVYPPCLCIQLFFRVIGIVQTKNFAPEELFFKSLEEAWFIYVILIQYFVFFISWTFSKGRQDILLLLSFLLSIAVAAAFCFTDLNARWYNGLLLFPIGMTVACYEKKLIDSLKRKWLLHFTIYLVVFMLAGGAFTYFKGDSVVVNLLKMLAGTCMSLLVCAIYMKVKLVSKIMRYIGRRSLFFYIVHMGLKAVVIGIEGMSGVKAFYIIFILTFIMVEIFYRLHLLVNFRLANLQK